jgi:hypothetical protein
MTVGYISPTQARQILKILRASKLRGAKTRAKEWEKMMEDATIGIDGPGKWDTDFMVACSDEYEREMMEDD